MRRFSARRPFPSTQLVLPGKEAYLTNTIPPFFLRALCGFNAPIPELPNSLTP